MKSMKMSCPNCQNSLQLPGHIERLTCSHCDTELVVQRGEGYAALQLAEPAPPEKEPLTTESSPGENVELSSNIPKKRSLRRTLMLVLVVGLLVPCCGLIWLLESSDEPDSAQAESVSTSETSEAPSPATTSTRRPTRTPTTTQTPTAAPVLFVTVSSNGNLRSGPGTTFEVIGSVTQNEELPVYGRSEDGTWLKVSITEPIWIWAQLVTLPDNGDLSAVPVPPTPMPTNTPTNTPTPDATATARNQTQMATSTARAQARVNATATILAYADSPPVGTWCDANGVRGVCVGNFEYRRSVGYTSAAASSRFIVFAVRVDNIDDTSISVNPFDVTLVLENGSTYSHDTETYSFSNHFDSVTISPGDSAQGAIVFLVANNVAPERVMYRGGLFEADVVINLKGAPVDQ